MLVLPDSAPSSEHFLAQWHFFSNALSRKPKCPKISMGQHQCSQWLEDISVNWASNESKAPSPVAAAVWTGTNVGHHKKRTQKRKINIETLRLNRNDDYNIRFMIFVLYFHIKLDNNGFNIFRLLRMYYSPTLLVLLVAKLGKNMTYCRWFFVAKMKTI